MFNFKHTFTFSQTTFIKPIYCRKSSRQLEPAIISQSKLLNNIRAFLYISPNLADVILRENDIEIDNMDRNKFYNQN